MVIVNLSVPTFASVMVVKLGVIERTVGSTVSEVYASWLDAVLVEDDWRPVKLKKGVYLGGKVEFYS